MTSPNLAAIPGARRVGSGFSTRPATASEASPVALPLAAPRLPSDLFAFVPSSVWAVDGTSLKRPAVYLGELVSVVAEATRESYANGPKQVVLEQVRVVGAGDRTVEVGAGLSAVLDELAADAVLEHERDLELGFADLWDDR